jgi:hypothetical protein
VSAVDWACATGPVGVLITEEVVGDPQWSLAGFGRTLGDGTPVGLAEGIGRWLLHGRPAAILAPGADLTPYTGLLVMGDGSAARTEKAPGHLPWQAAAFDDGILDALRQGDPGGLAGVDQELAREVVAAGAPAWQALGRSVAEVTEAVVDVATDPYGVLYVVARWTVRWADPA